MTPALTALTKSIETVLAGAIKTGFEMGGFDFGFDEDTLQRLNDALNGFGFTVCSMNYREDAICVTLQLSDDLTVGCGNNLFHFCQFCFNNDGEFRTVLNDEALDEGLNVTLTTPYDQHLYSKATSAEIDAAVEKFQPALQTRVLKTLRPLSLK